MGQKRIQDLPQIKTLSDNDAIPLDHEGVASGMTAQQLIFYLLTAADANGTWGIHIGSQEPSSTQNVWLQMVGGSPILSVRNLDTGLFESIPVVREKTTEDDFKRWFDSYNLEKNHPIGSYWWSDDPTNPQFIVGGQWDWVKGRFLLAADDATYKPGDTGGEATHVLTTDEMPAHTHAMGAQPPLSYGARVPGDNVIGPNGEVYEALYPQTGSTGGGLAHNNMPPYKATWCWQRVG